MPVPVEKITSLSCFRMREGAPRRVLLTREGIVTYILRSGLAWTVQRFHQDIASFAEHCEAGIDPVSLRDLS
jgi:hypothetical protein